MKALLFLTGFCVVFSSQAQEELVPLRSNLSLHYHFEEQQPVGATELHKPFSASLTPIQLPFLEDFFYATRNHLPDPAKWSDSLVYVNSGFPIAPPSIGVATFDGLNHNGYPYEPNYSNLNESRPADTLTSRDIDLYQSGSQILTPADSISFSFYYQARGNGEPPEPGDSLLLDFFRPSDSVWVNRVWYAKGNSNPNLIDTVFKRVYIPIDTIAYFQNTFRFRFRNKATTSGNFDHWHLDYIYLNKNRSYYGDTVYNDLTFAGIPTSYLKNYAAMPYQQYDSSEMAGRNSVRIKNNGSSTINMSYENRFFGPQNTLLHSYNGGASNLSPFKPNGYSTYQPHANPQFSYTFAPMNDSSDFTIKHFLYRSQGVSPDFLLNNDTIYQSQRFRNYYAHDDGSAEGGYYVSGVNSAIALRYKINKPDSLRALRIYFDPAGALTTAQQTARFRICIWSMSGDAPGTLLYKDSARYVTYFDTLFKLIPEYKLTTPYVLQPGVYFIGIRQEISSGIVIGFDRNYNFQYTSDNKHNLFYNLGSSWAPSSFKGALMMRPVFGKFIPSPAALHEWAANRETLWQAFPNPAREELNLHFVESAKRSVQVYNSTGQLLLSRSGFETQIRLETAELPDGIYMLRVLENGKQTGVQKIIIQH